MRKLFLILLIAGFGHIFAQSLPIIPQPQKVTPLTGEFMIREHSSLVNKDVNLQLFTDSPKEKAPKGSFSKNLLIKKIEQEFLFHFNIVENHTPNIILGIPSLNKKFYRLCRQKQILPEKLGPEGYYLLVEEDQIIISANQEAGLFYGVQSLIQLIRANQKQGFIPAVKIEDFPAFEHRAAMDDISRGPLSNMNFLKAQIERMAELKINRMTYYIEHVVKTKKHGSFAPEDGITIKEWEELSEFAKDYHIELIGSFQSLGHFKNILSFPQYAHLGATDGMLDPGNPEAIKFLTEVYDEMFPAFSSQYFNINGDEAWDLARGKLKPIADSLGAGFIYANHVEPLLRHVLAKGKKPMMWGDMALQHPEVFDRLPKETTILTWEYSSFDDFSYWIDPLKEKGFDFWVCPGIVNSNRLMPDYRGTMVNLRNFINEGYEKGAKGVMITVWDDGGRHFFGRDWYGMAYGAGQSWKPNRDSLEIFDQQFSQSFYGDTLARIPKIIHQLNKLTDISVTQEMNAAVLEKNLFSEGKNKLVFQRKEWEKVREITEVVETLLPKSDSSIYLIIRSSALKYIYSNPWKEDVDYWKFTSHQYKTLAESHLGLLEIAESYRKASIIQTQNTSEAKRYLELATVNSHLLQLNWKLSKHSFNYLWFNENRNDWFDVANQLYSDRFNAFSHLKEMLRDAKERLKHSDKQRYLLAPEKLGLNIFPGDGNYFTYWLITGPFPIEKYKPPFPDFLADMGGEKNAQPGPGLFFTAPDGKKHTWQKYDSPLPDRVDFTKIFETKIEAVAYAYCRIESPTDQKVKATFGSNDGLDIFLNGEKVVNIHQKRSLILNENEVWLNLKKGKNHILVKVDQWKAGWEFSFQLPDVEVRNHKHKYRIGY